MENKLENLHDVNKVMAIIKTLEEKKASNENFAKIELEKIQSWLDKENGTLDNKIEYYKGMILEYFMAEKSKNPKMKSLSTPNGTFKSRTTRKLNYDETAMEQYLLQNHSNLIETITVNKFNKADVKKLFKDGIDQFTGEVVDFVTESEEVTYSIKTTE